MAGGAEQMDLEEAMMLGTVAVVLVATATAALGCFFTSLLNMMILFGIRVN